ncbi:UNVERIFIED_CONTAM: putative beta-glucosidase 15 [Sesamum radiatum]|uniref:Beta-glucosidase 15 n=1 Tax=Sesamum radiatum TaxID=300843 RepID=A0AAW2LQB1_SESRA
MKRIHGNELPRFSLEERELLRDSLDFIGINHYGTLYAKDCIHSSCSCNDSSCTQGGDRAIRGFVDTTGVRNGVTIGEQVQILILYFPQTFCCSLTTQIVFLIFFLAQSRNTSLFLLQTGMSRFFVVPRGLEDIVSYIKDRYHNKPMMVTENGTYVHSAVFLYVIIYACPRCASMSTVYMIPTIVIHFPCGISNLKLQQPLKWLCQDTDGFI